MRWFNSLLAKKPFSFAISAITYLRKYLLSIGIGHFRPTELPSTLGEILLLKRISKELEKSGFDIVQPFNTKWYNEAVEESLKIRMLEEQQENCFGILIGNSKKAWPHFVKHVRANGISTDPFDDFTQNVVKDAGEKMKREGLVNKFKLYWVFDTEPGKMIHALKMAEISGLAYFDNSVHLCIHPEFGPWFGLRAALVVAPGGGGPGPLPGAARPPPPPDPLAPAARRRAEALFRSALAASGSPDPAVRAGAWQQWVALREGVAPGEHRHAYGADQTRYHYTKDVTILEKLLSYNQINMDDDGDC